jgi:predicted nucleotidyltransferase
MIRASAIPALPVPTEHVDAFCRRWKIVELSLFGSVLRQDFSPSSDVDVLVTFASGADWRFTHLLQMKEDLEALFGRRVGIIQKPVLEQSRNYIRRRNILESARPFYVA